MSRNFDYLIPCHSGFCSLYAADSYVANAQFSRPPELADKLKLLLGLLLDPAIFSGFAAAFCFLLHGVAVARFDSCLSLHGRHLVVVSLLSGWLLSELITMQKALEAGLTVLGTAGAFRG